MHRFSFSRWSALVLAGLTFSATAQTAPKPQEDWRSAFEGYRPFSDTPVASWRDANDTVGRVGGWRAYAREAAQPASPSPASGVAPVPAKPPAPAATGHQH